MSIRKSMLIFGIVAGLAMACGDDDPASSNNGNNVNNTNNQNNENNTNNENNQNNENNTNNENNQNNENNANNQNNENNTNNENNQGQEPLVEVADQTLASADQVVVARVVSDGPGWIVIHEDDGGAVGGVIGQTLLEDGESMDVAVTLDRDAVDGETLYAMLHIDAGELGTYEFPGDDAPVSDSNGDVIAPPFVVSVAAETEDNRVSVSDQTLTNLSTVVTIDSVELLQDGFVVIHEDDSGALGPVIGHTFVAEGTETNVEVVLDRPAQDGETLFAMLHIDDPANGDYTFDGANGEDVPATNEADDVVTEGFEVTVPAETPAIRFEVANVGSNAYRWDSVEPDAFADLIPNGDNGEVELIVGWRFEIVNQAYSSHPFEFIDQARVPPLRPMDTVLLGQDNEGTFADDTDVNLVESGGTFTFTLTQALAADLEGYRCAIPAHVSMRGDVVATTP